MSLTIGIDYGGVCSMHDTRHEDDTFNGEVGINVEGCMESLKQLKSMGHRLILISFCGAKRAHETQKYFLKLPEHPFDEVYFVKKRPSKQKICEYVGSDVMIDDRLDILNVIRNTKTLHFSSHPSDAECKFTPDYSAKTWQETVEIIKTLKPLGIHRQANLDIQHLIYRVYQNEYKE